MLMGSVRPETKVDTASWVGSLRPATKGNFIWGSRHWMGSLRPAAATKGNFMHYSCSRQCMDSLIDQQPEGILFGVASRHWMGSLRQPKGISCSE